MKQGERTARGHEDEADSPETVYHILHDYILEGMPCDRVNEPVGSSENEFAWKTTQCLHAPYWDHVKGDVQNFYDFRRAWVQAFVGTLNLMYAYEKQTDGTHRIIRR